MFDKDKKGFITILDVQRVLEVKFPCVLLVSFLSLLPVLQCGISHIEQCN